MPFTFRLLGLWGIFLLFWLSICYSVNSARSYVCSTDRDCSLNGVCNVQTGVCHCDPAWSGDDCGKLWLMPASHGTGFNYTGIGISSWGGRIIDDPYDPTLTHLFLAVMENECTLDNWLPNSKIVHAISYNSIEGPYKPIQDVLPTFHHNPTIITNAFSGPSSGGRFLLYCIGTEYIFEPFDCRNGTSYPGWNGWPYESGIMLYSSDSLYGPWTYHGYVLGNDTTEAWDVDTTNPSPLLINNGSLLLMYRGCPEGCGPELINLAYTNNPYDPTQYERVYSKPIFDNENEDPFVYQDTRGNFHALFHSLENGGGFGGPNIGRHAYTDDPAGISGWQFNTRTLAFNVTVHFTDGSTVDFYRRERPQLYFSRTTGAPIYLISGVQEQGTAMSYTLIQPINVVPFQNENEQSMDE